MTTQEQIDVLTASSPRRIELFMSVPSGVLQALGRPASCTHQVIVSNKAPFLLPNGHFIVPISYLDPTP